MYSIDFGSIGVDVANYTPGILHDLLNKNGLGTFISNKGFSNPNHVYSKGNCLQAVNRGIICERTSICVLNGYIDYTTDMDTYLLILSTALLDINTANALINDLFQAGSIKPRNVL